MRLRTRAGAYLDVVTREELHAALAVGATELPTRLKLRGTAVVPDPTANALVVLGSPPVGVIWDLRSVVVSLLDPTEEMTGKALVCIGITTQDKMRDATVLNPFDVIISTNDAPSTFTFGRHEEPVHNREELYVVFNDVGAGQHVVAHAVIEQWSASSAWHLEVPEAP